MAKDEFKCPACGQQQEIDEGKIRICSACGIVKDKYELAQKRKQLESDHLRQQKLIDRSSGKKDFTSIEQRNEAFLKKKRDKRKPKAKADPSTLFTLLLIFSAISAGGYMYFASNQGENDIAEVTKNGAEYFLDAAHQQLGKTRLSVADVDRFYGLLAQSYANIFEFGQANTLLTHIKNTQEKNRIAQVVTIIEKKAVL